MSENAVRTKFVLLSSARSGTSALMEGIDQHEDTYCHREIFLKRSLRTVKEEFRDAFDVVKLKEHPIEYVDTILNFTPGPKCVGFKMWHIQSPEACDYLLKNENVKKIVLERTNYLAQFSSQMISKASPTSHAQSEKKRDEFRANVPKVSFDRDAFEKFAIQRSKLYERYLKRAQGDVLYLKYTDINNDAFARAFNFLGLKPMPVEPAYLKLNSSDIVSRFDPRDRKEILRSLEHLGHPEWITE